MSEPRIVCYNDKYFSILRRQEDWGIATFDLAVPPHRFWSDEPNRKPAVEVNVDPRRVRFLASPSELLCQGQPDDNWAAQSRRSIGRLWAHYLICEDPQRRMDARPVATLAHQVSLVQYLLENDHLRRVLIADEVGLGKTVEVGLLVSELLQTKPGLRILYLAPARLVDNVAREFDRLELAFRRWKTGEQEARLTDPRVIASIHRAVHPNNFERLLEAPQWDIIVVDECHHLSAWSPGGGDPVEKFRLIRELANRQHVGSRLLLLSGTPHQGHATRFDNVLDLLRWPSEKRTDVGGRVIYRTKEDIRDWRGNPVFPPRQVNEPIVLDLGEDHREWLQNIHSFYTGALGVEVGNAKRRASGWRCAQALQWTASSPQAGLGYLVRQAIRNGWTLTDPSLAEALSVLRPYRAGEPDETLDSLFARMSHEIRQQRAQADLDDIEEDSDNDGSQSTDEHDAMRDLLRQGVKVLRSAGDEKWRILKERILDRSGNDKVVLFAQPIETVISLSRYLEKMTGEKPAIIIGGQTDRDRKDQEDNFRKRTGPRFLVSSRAGGEGINLQVAHRLVHVDVPWNPMELEQRVGRIHRFGSRQTIIVDTLVVRDSREADAYRIARQKLHTIATTLRPQDFELIFSRVMSLVPPEELQNVLIEGALSPLSGDEAARLSQMVESGFREWRKFHETFNLEQKKIRQLDGGLVSWEDVENFLTKYTGAQPVEGFYSPRFSMTDGVSQNLDEPVNVFRLPEGGSYATGDIQGASVFGPNDERADQLGLNSPAVAESLRQQAFPAEWCGAAHLRIELKQVSEKPTAPIGIIAFLVQPLKSEPHDGWQQLSPRLQLFEVVKQGGRREVTNDEKRHLLRLLLASTIRTKPLQDESLLRAIASSESELFEELRRPSDEQISAGIRHAVTPLFAATVS